MTVFAKIKVMRQLGVPYTDEEEANAVADLQAQAAVIVKDLKDNGIEADPNKEIIALIAYLQRLGTDISKGAGESKLGQAAR